MKSITWYLRAVYYRLSRFLYPRYKRNWIVLFRYTSALGDALFLTTIAREIKKRNPNCLIHVVTGLPVIFERNPDVDLVSLEPKHKVNHLGKYLINYGTYFPWKKHLLNYCVSFVDIHDEIDLRTYIYPTDEDLLFAKNFLRPENRKIILINRKAGPRTDKKNWPDHYWHQLVHLLIAEYTIIEIGSVDSDSLKIDSAHYINLTGKTTIHQTAALMSVVDLLICPITGLLHLASAFDLPVLCILGGSEPSVASKYKHTHYMEFRPECADCYEKGPCMNDFLCLTTIKPEQVFQKAREIAAY